MSKTAEHAPLHTIQNPIRISPIAPLRPSDERLRLSPIVASARSGNETDSRVTGERRRETKRAARERIEQGKWLLQRATTF
jgi:hypothetical protein